MIAKRNGQAERNGQGAMEHSIELHKMSKKRLNAVKLEAQIGKVTQRALASRGKHGWSVEIANKDWTLPTGVKTATGEYRYVCNLQFAFHAKRERKPETIKQEWHNIIKAVGGAANAPGWGVETIDGKMPKAAEKGSNVIGYVPVELPDDWRDHLVHLYELDAQIDILVSSVKAAIDSDFHKRFHCALIGEPGCGKTDTLHGLKAALGEDAVLEYDATATTQAGAIKDLDERAELPRILVVEEIEKTPEDSLRWLLGVMDQRAEIRKVNYRENIQKETRMLTLATVNDYKLFKKIMFGSLASRFAFHLCFPKPDRALLTKILEREVAGIKGDRRWIEPTLDFAVAEGIYDPRKVTAICLSGKDDLLKGAYQAKLKLCSTKDFEKNHARIVEEQ